MGKATTSSDLKKDEDSVETAYITGTEDYIIPVVFPDYKIGVGGYKAPYLGHAGVLLIKGGSGGAKYYEYGRYDAADLGIVRTTGVANVRMKGGSIVVSSFKKMLRGLSVNSGQSGDVSGAIFRKENVYSKAISWLEERKKENKNKDRPPYTLYDNNCATFVDELLEYLDLPSVISSYSTPIEYMKSLQWRARDLTYKYKDDKLEVDY
ncbi:hypothetical protein [Entomohabitans teleogrylli]|uniref:hypothetical protein n=1 Tax=Entomohabitans teleogrylli TaxID=1384589 RepID=UPI00073D4C26|nr:hypothetical protein [Entomohabitans teleogrylli]